MSKKTHLSTRILEGEHPRIEIDGAELRIASGPDKGVKVQLGTESILIGSAADCDLVLHDPTVSARHAEIIAKPDGYTVRDLGSTNGVLIGTTYVERAPLGDGMRMRLGETTLSVHSLGEKTVIPLARSGLFGQLAAHSVKMRAAVAQFQQIAPTDVTVLIEGETGTGKEVAASALHGASVRRNHPFVVFDCGAVTSALAAAELFGHEKGAFTGADAARAGLWEEAEGGTLFLDEIGELPLDVQPLLLGAIERKSSRRIGGTHEISHNVRLVAATNRNLAEEVRGKRFREDLYFRLSVARVRLPPLRERPEDLPILARRFADETGLQLSPTMLSFFAAHDWPGNVRELRNTITRMAAQPQQTAELSGHEDLAHASTEDHKGNFYSLPEARRLSGHAFERYYLERVIKRADGNLSRAAELAGVSRRFLTRLAAKHGLRLKDRAEDAEP